MERYQFEYLVALSEHKTLLATAEALHVSQPSITKALKKTEEEFGFPLFDRVKNRLVFNQYGLEVLKYAKRILSDMEEMENSVRVMYEANTNIIVAGNAPAPLWGVKYLLEDRVKPVIQPEVEQLLEGLQKQMYTMIILDYPIHDDRYICTEICQEKLFLAVKPDHALARCKQVSFAEMDGLTILRRSNVGYWMELSQEFMPKSKFILEENDETYRILSQSSNLPVFRTNLSLQEWQGKEDRVYVPVSNPEAKLSFYAVYDKRNRALFDEKLSNTGRIDWTRFEAKQVTLYKDEQGKENAA